MCRYTSAEGVATAADGVYVTGWFNIDGFGTDYEAFLAKYDASGNRLWYRVWGGTNHEFGASVAVATDGVYLGGNINSTFATIVKFDVSGNQLWNRTFGETYGMEGYDVATANDGVYLVGTVRTPAPGYLDAFVVKYNASGYQLWNRTWGGDSYDYGRSVAVATDGVYLTGETYSFGTTHSDAFIAKYNASGTQLWNCTYERGDYEIGESVAVATDGVYMVVWTDNFDYDEVDGDTSLIKYDAAGNQLWNWSCGWKGDDFGRDVAVSVDGGVYMTGYTNSFGGGRDDVFLMKFNDDGTQLWAYTWGERNWDIGLDISVTSNQILIAGQTGEEMNRTAFLAKFDPNALPITQQVDYAILFISIICIAAFVAAVSVIVLRQEFKNLPSKMRSLRETIAARRHATGKVEEIVYRQPRREPTAPRKPAAQPSSLAAACCPGCGQPVPKGFEKSRFCVYCGRAFQGAPA